MADAKSQSIGYGYFLDNNLKQITYTNAQHPTPNVSFTYDAVYNRLATMTDGTGTTAFFYHPITTPPSLGAGGLANVDGPLSNDAISYNYDSMRRAVGRTINGVSLGQTYDALDRVNTETNALGTFTYGYDSASTRLATVNYPNGQTTTYAYLGNTGDRGLQEIKHANSAAAIISKLNFGYDAARNLTAWTHQLDSNPAKAFDFSYDGADQLTSATFRSTDPTPVLLKRYVNDYDMAANRTSEQIDDSVIGASYGIANQLISVQPGGALRFKGTVNEAATVAVQGNAGQVGADNQFEGKAHVPSGTSTVAVAATDASGNTRTYTYQLSVTGAGKTLSYDASGNLTSDGTRTFEWDAENRLVAVVQGTLRSEFTYDGFFRRTRVVERDGAATLSDRRLLWCETEICEERDATGATVTRRFFRLGMQEGSDSFFYTQDYLGSIREVTDTSGQVRARYDYDPWGRTAKISGDKASVFGFTGHYYHEPSGLLLTRYRAYDADLGRWLSPDPLEFEGGVHLSRDRDRASEDAAREPQRAGRQGAGQQGVAGRGGSGQGERNAYVYAQNNPVNVVDPEGTQCVVLGTQTPVFYPEVLMSRQLPVWRLARPPIMRPPRVTPPRPWLPPAQPAPPPFYDVKWFLFFKFLEEWLGGGVGAIKTPDVVLPEPPGSCGAVPNCA